MGDELTKLFDDLFGGRLVIRDVRGNGLTEFDCEKFDEPPGFIAVSPQGDPLDDIYFGHGATEAEAMASAIHGEFDRRGEVESRLSDVIDRYQSARRGMMLAEKDLMETLI